MNKTALTLGLIGALALLWGGNSIESHLGLGTWNPDVVIFAIGVILLGQTPAILLYQRVRRLEKVIGAMRGPEVTPADNM